MAKSTRMVAAVLFSGAVIVSSFLGVKAMAGSNSAATPAVHKKIVQDPPVDQTAQSDQDQQLDQDQQSDQAAKAPASGNIAAQDALDYLNEIALDGFEFGSAPKVAYKWTEDVKVRVDGNPTASDRAAIQQVISDLNSLIAPTKVELVDQGENVTIWYGPEKQFSQQMPDYTPGNLGYFSVRYDDNYDITHSSILIDTGTEATARAHLVREELTQSLGLFQDSWDYKDSMFYQGWTTPTKYSDLDKQIIHMLYDTRVKPGMKKSQVDALFEN